MLRTYTPTSAQRAITFLCLDFNGQSVTFDELPHQRCPSGIRTQAVSFFVDLFILVISQKYHLELPQLLGWKGVCHSWATLIYRPIQGIELGLSGSQISRRIPFRRSWLGYLQRSSLSGPTATYFLWGNNFPNYPEIGPEVPPYP